MKRRSARRRKRIYLHLTTLHQRFRPDRKTCRPSIPALMGGHFAGGTGDVFLEAECATAHTLLWPFIHELTPVAFWLTPVNAQRERPARIFRAGRFCLPKPPRLLSSEELPSYPHCTRREYPRRRGTSCASFCSWSPSERVRSRVRLHYHTPYRPQAASWRRCQS